MEVIKKVTWFVKMEIECGAKMEVKFDIKLEAILAAITSFK